MITAFYYSCEIDRKWDILNCCLFNIGTRQIDKLGELIRSLRSSCVKWLLFVYS